jgi:hypothetical protein
MSEFSKHFMVNQKFVTEIIFTVDGGGDERPRNKLTKFLLTLCVPEIRDTASSAANSMFSENVVLLKHPFSSVSTLLMLWESISPN